VLDSYLTFEFIFIKVNRCEHWVRLYMQQLTFYSTGALIIELLKLICQL
jgi:hypothetical protein